MRDWWRAVERQRRKKYGLKSEDGVPGDDIEGPVEQNDTARLLGLEA